VLFAVLLLAGCREPEGTWVDATADDRWPVDTGVPPRPMWSAQEVADQVDRAASFGVPTPQRVLSDYLELLSHGDDACPGHYFEEGFVVLGGCDSGQGYHYTGAAGVVREDTRQGDAGSGHLRVNSAPADYVITRPDGSRLIAGGTFFGELRSQEGLQQWTVRLGGTFEDDAATDWLGAGFSGLLAFDGLADMQGVQQRVSGSLSVGGVAIDMQEVVLNPSICPDGFMGGRFRVRQPDASWNELVLPDSCGSCGSVRWEGTELPGSGCVNPKPWIDQIAALRSW
jgi:hypothetical protein